MAFFPINKVAIRGVAAAVPTQKESNHDYKWLSESERHMLIRTTGVEERRKAPRGMSSSDLCKEAAEELLTDLKWEKSDIEVLVFVSQSTDYYLPATSVILQDRLGLPKNCLAFDVGMGCSGYIYGLSVISSMLSSGALKKGLLLVGDISSLTCSPKDKSTYPLFGDSGTATAMEFNPDGAEMIFDLNSDGSGYEAIIIPDGGARNLASPSSFEEKEVEKGIIRSRMNLVLNGIDVFNFSIHTVSESIMKFMEKTKSKPSDYDHFVMHQANLLMNETIRRKTKFSEEQTPYSIDKFGNTSSASIPLTIVSCLKGLARSKSLNLLCSGFGVGLSWGTVNFHLDRISCPDLIEV